MNYRVEALKIIMKGRIWTNTANNEIIIHDNGHKPTETEIQEKIEEVIAAEPMRLLRMERNNLLANTDWVSVRSVDSGTSVSQEWLEYRQALRDLPATAEPQLDEFGNLTNVTWPELPQ